MLNTIIAAIVGRILAHRRIWGIVGLAVVTGATLLASRVSLGHDMADLLPRRHAAPPPWDSIVQARFGTAGRIVVFVESDAPVDSDSIAPVLETLAVMLAGIDGVRRVEYRLRPGMRRYVEEKGPELLLLYLPSFRVPEFGGRFSKEAIDRALTSERREASQATSALGAELAARDPLGVLVPAVRTVEQLTGASRVRLSGGYFALPGNHTYFLIVEPVTGLEAIEAARSVVEDIEAVLDEIRTDERYRPLLAGKRMFAVGRPISYVQAFATAINDIRRVALASAAAVFVLLMLVFRRAAAPLILLAPVAVGLAITGAVAFMVFESVSLFAWVFVVLLIGLGVDFGLHVASHYWITGTATRTRKEALIRAVSRPGRGIVFGGLTSAAAFMSLATVSYPVMTQVAVLVSVGVLAILAATITVLPWLLSFTPPTCLDRSGWQAGSRFLVNLGRRFPMWGIAGWASILVGSSLLASRVNIEVHPWALALRANPKTAQMERLRSQLGSSFTPLLMVSRGRSPDEALSRDRAAVAELDRLRQLAGAASIESLSRWVPPLEQQLHNLEYADAHPRLFSAERFHDDFMAAVGRPPDADPYLVEEYLPLVTRFLEPSRSPITLERLAAEGGASVIDRHLVVIGDTHVAVSYVYLKKFPWAEGAVSRFLHVVDRFGGEGLHSVRFVGNALRSASHDVVLRRDAFVATAVAVMLVATLLAIQFRRPGPALLCLIPLAFGVSVSLGVMALLGIQLNVLTLAIAPVLVGIGVDDGIHIVERLARGEETEAAVRESGTAMTMTTLTSVAAFAGLGLASFPGVRDVGLIGAVGLITSLLASLHLLPIVYRTVGRSGGGAVL